MIDIDTTTKIELENKKNTTMMSFNHISEVYEFFDKFKTPEDLEHAFEEIPAKFGSFDITNRSSYKKEGFIEICNTYFDKSIGDYDYDYHTVVIEEDE